MRYAQGRPHELRDAFWRALADSPYLMLQLDADADSAAPMTASLDEDADHAIWFFAARDNRFARLDRQWSRFVDAWFPRGKDDPALLFLRMDLGDASIWSGALGVLATARIALGLRVRDEVAARHVETAL